MTSQSVSCDVTKCLQFWYPKVSVVTSGSFYSCDVTNVYSCDVTRFQLWRHKVFTDLTSQSFSHDITKCKLWCNKMITIVTPQCILWRHKMFVFSHDITKCLQLWRHNVYSCDVTMFQLWHHKVFTDLISQSFSRDITKCKLWCNKMLTILIS